MWTRLPGAETQRPPYDIDHLHDVHDFVSRSQQCHSRMPHVLSYGWQEAEDKRQPPQLLRGEELCKRLRGSPLMIIGDSLSLQFFDSWRARLRQHRYERGAASVAQTCQNVIPNPCEGPMPSLCIDAAGAALCTGQVTHGQSAMFAACDNGATMYVAQAYRWVMDPSSFSSSDPVRGARCAHRVRQNPRSVGLVPVPPAHLMKMVQEAVNGPPGIRAAPHNGRRRPKVTLVINQFAHIHNFIGSVLRCYAEDRLSWGSVASPLSMATRDVLRFWSADQARWAAVLQAIKQNLSSHPSAPVDLQVFYRLSPPACDAACVAPQGAHHPIQPAVLLDGTLAMNSSQYSHQLVFAINDASAAAFRAHGHGIIDQETMLGARVDAHPGSFDGQGDKLHFCQPGPLDWALDSILRRTHPSEHPRPGVFGVTVGNGR